MRIVIGLVICGLFSSACGQKASSKSGGAHAVASSTATAGQTATGTFESTGTDATASGDLKIFPEKIYSGFDGRDPFKIPVASSQGRGVTWSVDKPNLITLKQNADGTAMLETKGSGTAHLTAHGSGGATATATITIAKYATADYDWGQKRYKTQLTGESKPCSDCHGTGKSAPDHTPTQTAADSDATVEKSYAQGVDPDGSELNAGDHKWKVSNSKGMIAFLRGLEPREYPSEP